MDGLPPKILKEICKGPNVKRLQAIYKASYGLGYVPRCWRIAKVIFLDKPNKKDYSEVKFFQPISLGPLWFKGMERLMGWHLETTTLKTNPLHKYQFAFRRGVSTEVAMAKAVDFIESAIYRGQMVLAVFCDIQAAFDTISIEEMITEMENRNFPSQFINNTL